MLHSKSFSLSPISHQLIEDMVYETRTVIEARGVSKCFKDNTFTAFGNNVSNEEYGLGRLVKVGKISVNECLNIILNDFLDGIGFDGDRVDILSGADLLFFSEVDEHTDDCGERCLLVLKAPNGFELNNDDLNEESYSIPLLPFCVYSFNENLPHDVTRYSYTEKSPYDKDHDFCIAINIPYHADIFKIKD